MLLNIHFHDPYFPSLGLDFWEESILLHLVMGIQDFRPALSVGNEIGMFF
jgi:hypothetical protein